MSRPALRVFTKEGDDMKKLLSIALSLFVAVAVAATTTYSLNAAALQGTNTAAKPRKPIFRASKDQIMQAQKILKDRGFYTGEQTGKLDDDTRAGLKKYQTAESLKVTGTLNKITLEKMGVELTDKQKAM
jgi:peptidoglycan hydrolase-like protein with peptidoglycan-binding domain